MCQSDNNAYFGLSAESLSFGPSVAIAIRTFSMTDQSWVHPTGVVIW